MRSETVESSAALAPASWEVEMHVIIFATGEVMVVQADSRWLGEDDSLSPEFLQWVQQIYGDVASAMKANSVLHPA